MWTAAVSPSEATDKSKGYGTVTVDTLHLRASRGTDSSIVTNLKQGDTFQISSSQKGLVWRHL